MKNNFFIYFLLLSVSVFGQPSNDTKSLIDDLAGKLIRKGPIRALSVGVIQNGKTIILHYGDLGNGVKPNDESSYELASITKTFTGMILAQAVQDKKLNLDDDIRKYMIGNFPNLEYEGSPITFRHLATHMAGLPYTFPDKPELFRNPDYDKLPFILDSLEKGYTKDDFFRDLLQARLNTKPGSQFKYSNVDANLLAYIFETVYAKSYQELLSNIVFKPASMAYTILHGSGRDTIKHVMGFNTKQLEMPSVSISSMAAAGLMSNLPDMMKYVSFNLNENDPLVKTAHEPMWKAGKGSYSTGYFWQMDIVKGGRKLFQNGGSYGTSSWLELYPDSQIGIFIISNVSGPDIHPLLSDLAGKIYKGIKK